MEKSNINIDFGGLGLFLLIIFIIWFGHKAEIDCIDRGGIWTMYDQDIIFDDYRCDYEK